jgi:2-phosphosulfolactate phosphatase
MGNAGVRTAGEDMLCARYIRSILEEQPLDVQPLADALRETDGAKFFDPARTEFPQADFPLCVDCDRFPFVLRLERDERGRNRMVPVHI